MISLVMISLVMISLVMISLKIYRINRIYKINKIKKFNIIKKSNRIKKNNHKIKAYKVVLLNQIQIMNKNIQKMKYYKCNSHSYNLNNKINRI